MPWWGFWQAKSSEGMYPATANNGTKIGLTRTLRCHPRVDLDLKTLKTICAKRKTRCTRV